MYLCLLGTMPMVCVSWEAQHAKEKKINKIKVGFVYSKRLKKSNEMDPNNEKRSNQESKINF